MKRTAWILPTLLLTIVSAFPITAGKLKFVPIYKTLTIKANKKLPPHIAYLDSHFDIHDMEWSDLDKKSKQTIGAGLSDTTLQGPYMLTQKRTLEGFVIRKSVETIALNTAGVRKTSMQAMQENEGPQWLQNIVREPATTFARAAADVHPQNLMAAKRITGPIELTQGLAVTNEHHIEIRRADEGVFREIGQVDLMKGSYSIDIDEASGAIVARLLDRAGLVLGEGSIRLSKLQAGDSRLIYGPRLEISPSPSWTGKVSSYYPSSSKGQKAPPRVTTFGGQNNVNVAQNGDISLENVKRNSTTVARVQADGHTPSNRILIAGEKQFSISMFPTSMIEALKTIVAEQKRIVPSKLAESSVVWGTASLDGKPISGVTVVSETDPEAKAIYFNEFMLPDPNLTSTSASGVYAFIDLENGFHALLAQRGDAYFGHQNVEVEPGSVAIGDIENTLHTEPVRIRAYDAFNGEAVSMVANLQSLEEPVTVSDGAASIILPQVSRQSMIYTEAPAGYVSSNYFYNDQDSFIHLPMISSEWLAEIRISAKVNEISRTGTVVGFFSEESFEVYLAGQDKDEHTTIVYFDATGKVVDNGKNAVGGGFIIFNVTYGTQEVVVVGASEKISSRVVPVDADTVTTLNFNAY